MEREKERQKCWHFLKDDDFRIERENVLWCCWSSQDGVMLMIVVMIMMIKLLGNRINKNSEWEREAKSRHKEKPEKKTLLVLLCNQLTCKIAERKGTERELKRTQREKEREREKREAQVRREENIWLKRKEKKIITKKKKKKKTGILSTGSIYRIPEQLMYR